MRPNIPSNAFRSVISQLSSPELRARVTKSGVGDPRIPGSAPPDSAPREAREEQAGWIPTIPASNHLTSFLLWGPLSFPALLIASLPSWSFPPPSSPSRSRSQPLCPAVYASFCPRPHEEQEEKTWMKEARIRLMQVKEEQG